MKTSSGPPLLVTWVFVGGVLVTFASIRSTSVVAAYFAYLILAVTILNYGEKALSTLGFSATTTSGGGGGRPPKVL